jgi:hypothetical protein
MKEKSKTKSLYTFYLKNKIIFFFHFKCKLEIYETQSNKPQYSSFLKQIQIERKPMNVRAIVMFSKIRISHTNDVSLTISNDDI